VLPVLGPPPAEPSPYEPTEEDWSDFRRCCEEVDARNRDRDDADREAAFLEMLEREHKFTDRDLAESCGLQVG
jgi:hypothetical protein